MTAKTQPFWWFKKPPAFELLDVDGFDATIDSIPTHGISPFLDAADEVNWVGYGDVACMVGNSMYYSFKDTTFGSISKCVLKIRLRNTEGEPEGNTDHVWVYLFYNATDFISHVFTSISNGEWHEEEWDVSDTFNTPALVNFCKARLYVATPWCHIGVDHLYLRVEE